MATETYDKKRWTTGRKLLFGTPSTPGDVTYFFIDCPPPSGTKSKGTILLIHGYPETSYQWRHVMTPLSDAGYRVIAPDCRGAGYSSKTRGMEGYSKKSIAADLAKLLEVLEIEEKIHVVGHDIGGMTAHSFASQYPEKTASVMWGECPQPGTKKYEETKNTEAVWHFTFQQQSDLPEALVQGRERIYLMHFYERLAYRADVWTPPVLDFYTQAFAQPGAVRSGMDLYRTFPIDVEDNRATLQKSGKCKVPACAFSGAQSFLAGIARSQTEELYENVEVAEVEESGHWVAEENPEGCVREIVKFVGKHSV